MSIVGAINGVDHKAKITAVVAGLYCLIFLAVIGAVIGPVDIIGVGKPSLWQSIAIAELTGCTLVVAAILGILALRGLHRRLDGRTSQWASGAAERWRSREGGLARAAAPWPVGATSLAALAALAAIAWADMMDSRLEAPHWLSLGCATALTALAVVLAHYFLRPWMRTLGTRLAPPRWARRAALVVFTLPFVIVFGLILASDNNGLRGLLPIFLYCLPLSYSLDLATRYYRILPGKIAEVGPGDERQRAVADRSVRKAYVVIVAIGIVAVLALAIPGQVTLGQAALLAFGVSYLGVVLPGMIRVWVEPDHHWVEVDDDELIYSPANPDTSGRSTS